MAQDAGPFHCFRPAPPLSDLVDFLWTYDGYLPPHAQERLLPTGTMELVFTMDAAGNLAAGISGPYSECMTLETLQPFSVVAVHFKPGGGVPFFGLPSSELHNRRVALDLLWGGRAASLRDQLWEATTARDRFSILEHALVDQARRSTDPHPAVRYAIDWFERSKGVSRVRDVVQRIGLSPRRFAEIFRTEVGLLPKAFCRIRRFNEVLCRVDGMTHVDWSNVALSCGYFDQAHFNHDFRAFAGLSPSAYLRQRLARRHVAVGDTHRTRSARL
jgi:AraC-like DNA-binding protein